MQPDFGLDDGWGGALRVPSRFLRSLQSRNYDQDDRNTLICRSRRNISNISDQSTSYVIGSGPTVPLQGGMAPSLDLVNA